MLNKDKFFKGIKETGLYVITDTKMASMSHCEIVEECVKGGAKIIQIRDKMLGDGEFLAIAERILKNFPDIFLIINDRVDVALLSKANGVHLGQDDLPVKYARELLGENTIIGISTHNAEQFNNALKEEVDYIACGPIFYTNTKVSNNEPLGVEYAIKARQLTDKCLIAIGGININNAETLWENGIDAVAVVSDIMKSGNIAKRINEYITIYKRIRRR
jgi:thiamine-phosphate pyrophosphorylase